jgi:hypothetical protein
MSSSPKKEVPMKLRQAALVALVAVVSLTSVSAAAPDAAKQRIAITTKGVANPSGFGEFVLTPLEAGALKRDAGAESSVWSERVVMREGRESRSPTASKPSKGSGVPSRSAFGSSGSTAETDTTPAPAPGR